MYEAVPEHIQEVVTPYPPTPLQSLMFYGNYRIKMKKEGSGHFKLQPAIVVVGPQYSRVNLMGKAGCGMYTLSGNPLLFDVK